MAESKLTDAELTEFLALTPEEAAIIFAKITPEKRAVWERMAEVYGEIVLWEAGVGRKPSGVILCGKQQVRGAGR